MIALLSVLAKAKPHGQGSAVSQATNYGGECLFLTWGRGRKSWSRREDEQQEEMVSPRSCLSSPRKRSVVLPHQDTVSLKPSAAKSHKVRPDLDIRVRQGVN